MSQKIRLVLTLTVDYDLNGTSVDKLKDRLLDLASFAAGEGLLNGAWDAEVDEWSAEVNHEELT